MKRIFTRFIALAITYAIVIYVVPTLINVASGVSNVFALIPSWGYYSCCSIGFIFFIFMLISQNRMERNRERAQSVLEEIVNEFESRISSNPIETKLKYLELRAAVKNHDDATAAELAEKVYGKRHANWKLFAELDKKLSSIESGEIAEGIEIFMQKLKDKPKEARRLADELSEALLFEKNEPKATLKLSQTLFDGKVFVYQPTIKRITRGCYEAIQDNAVNEIKEKMIKNAESTREIYRELENALRDNNDTELIYDLCEKLFGNKYLPINQIGTTLIFARKHVEGKDSE